MATVVFFFQAEDGIRDYKVTGVQTCALPISIDVICCRGGAPGAVAQKIWPPGTLRVMVGCLGKVSCSVFSADGGRRLAQPARGCPGCTTHLARHPTSE